MENTKQKTEDFLKLLEKLLSEKIPTENLVSLGAAISKFRVDDWKNIVSAILVKDLKPVYLTGKEKILSFKKIKENLKIDGPKGFFKNIAGSSKDLIKDLARGSIKNAKISIPEAKDRLSIFSKKIVNDYNSLSTNEDRGRYILKLSLYSGIFGVAFHRGTKHKFLSFATLPLVASGVTLLFVNRLLEEAEAKLSHDPGAVSLSKDIRSLIKTLNMGFSSGMTFNIMVDGLIDQKIEINDLNGKTIGSLMPKSVIDNMIYTTLMGLFSTEKE
jgi:hypothetical protein